MKTRLPWILETSEEITQRELLSFHILRFLPIPKGSDYPWLHSLTKAIGMFMLIGFLARPSSAGAVTDPRMISTINHYMPWIKWSGKWGRFWALPALENQLMVLRSEQIYPEGEVKGDSPKTY